MTDGRIHGLSCRLKESLEDGKAYASDGVDAAYAKILAPQGNDGAFVVESLIDVPCHELHIRVGPEETEEDKDEGDDDSQCDATSAYLVGHFLVSFAKALGEHRVDADTRSYSYGDHEDLYGEGKRQGLVGNLAESFPVDDEDRVDDIVDGL